MWKKKSDVFDPLKLHRAKSGEKVRDYLKRDGVDPKARDGRGDTPIHAFIRRKDHDKSLECLFAFLIYAEYEIDILNKDADTPLHLACKLKNMDFIKALVAFDADLNVFNRDNLTPLDIAEAEKCEDIAKLLTEIGGLTGKSILDRSQEIEDSGYTFEMDKEVMTMGSMEVVDMAMSLGGARGAMTGGHASRSKAGVSPSALTTRLEGVAETDREDVGYQRQSDMSTDSIYYSPPEENKMESIAEDSDEEFFETSDGSGTFDIQYHDDRILRENMFPLRGDKSPSPGRRDHSPIRPSNLLQRKVSPGKSPVNSRSPVQGSPHSRSPMTSTLSLSPAAGRTPTRTPPPSKTPPLSKTPPPSKTPPQSKTPTSPGSKSPMSEKTSSNPLNATDAEKQKQRDMCISYQKIIEEKKGDSREAASSDNTDDPVVLRGKPTDPAGLLCSAMKKQDATGRRYTDGAIPRHVRFNVGDSLRPYRLRGSKAALHSSLSISRSLYNTRMSVTESDLGLSVKPVKPILKDTQRGHRILSLDGGGIKGVIELEILRGIVRLADCSIPELFDWIVATSVGGIFALAMVYGKCSVNDLFKLCFRMKDDVMKKTSWWRYSCNTAALESMLKDVLGKDTKMDGTNSKTKISLAGRSPHFCRSCFFQSAEGYLDGGLVANNPCNYGLTKIKVFLRELKQNQIDRGEKKTVATDISCILSVGTGQYPPQKIGNCDIDDGLLTRPHEAASRIKNAMQTLLACIGRSEEDAHICRIFCEEMQIPFYRFNPKVHEVVGTAETDNMKICEAIICAKKMLHKDEAHLEELVRHLGKEPVPQTKVETFV